MRDQWRMRLLLIVHFSGILFIFGCALVRIPRLSSLSELPLVPLLAVDFCQTCLLGSWVAFSEAAWWKRSVGLIVGDVFLEILLDVGVDEVEFFLMAIMVSLGMAGISLVVRRWVATLRHLPSQGSASAGEALKFSIRGLMSLTLVIALFIAGAKELRESYSGGPFFLIISAAWSVCFVVVGLASLWAALGTTRPFRCCVVVLALSLAFGALFVYAIDCEDRWETCFYVFTIMALQTAILLGSLLVVRSCGYRLVRRSDASSQRPEEMFLALDACATTG